MSTSTVLIVDDDEQVRRMVVRFLGGGQEQIVLTAANGEEAIRALGSIHVDVIISDIVMPVMDGAALLKEVKARFQHVPFIVLTGNASIVSAVSFIRQGAYDYLEKPFSPEVLRLTVDKAIQHARLTEQIGKLRGQLRNMFSFQNIVTRSPAMEKALKLAERVATTPNTTVAIYGESGTGKEVLAKAIHYAGDRMENRFVAVSCAGIPATLLEDELFGHVKGAFTGADRDRQGRFGLAQKGTILLDEIGDLAPEMQLKLLRVLQERVFEKLGSATPIPLDCRVIVATHRNLREMVRQGTFREDLFHRINVFPVELPPLRERSEDIPLLVARFLEQLRLDLGRRLPGISEEAMEVLMRHSWPGNVREMRNSLERAAILSGDELIRPEHLPIAGPAHTVCSSRRSGRAGSVCLDIDLTDPETSLDSIVERTLKLALEACEGNKTQAAELLKVNRKMFYRRD